MSHDRYFEAFKKLKEDLKPFEEMLKDPMKWQTIGSEKILLPPAYLLEKKANDTDEALKEWMLNSIPPGQQPLSESDFQTTHKKFKQLIIEYTKLKSELSTFVDNFLQTLYTIISTVSYETSNQEGFKKLVYCRNALNHYLKKFLDKLPPIKSSEILQMDTILGSKITMFKQQGIIDNPTSKPFWLEYENDQNIKYNFLHFLPRDDKHHPEKSPDDVEVDIADRLRSLEMSKKKLSSPISSSPSYSSSSSSFYSSSSSSSSSPSSISGSGSEGTRRAPEDNKPKELSIKRRMS